MPRLPQQPTKLPPIFVPTKAHSTTNSLRSTLMISSRSSTDLTHPTVPTRQAKQSVTLLAKMVGQSRFHQHSLVHAPTRRTKTSPAPRRLLVKQSLQGSKPSANYSSAQAQNKFVPPSNEMAYLPTLKQLAQLFLPMHVVRALVNGNAPKKRPTSPTPLSTRSTATSRNAPMAQQTL
ncbi:unannotated protein [freshwater metagenome]|uniref:Unannotated protein n=1 Tax=freshwater metagenome TaxID=449393 RepID=A0A6J7DWW9_9ZZZZ